ncbi:PREDICTED: elicitor-responsive protein 3-like [Ipomoea nil]|uniref:elicitor-responsive protein 3-like n=1 Tax=Ipomoea nil TaxID=35883 RepID=UPI0009017FB1|nr:PREDICTED: elicitor-responsive protein 3-like [Ipomoea nil]
MSNSGIHGRLLELTVVSCSRLKNTEWISRQDPYVCLDYATTKYRTKTCTDGGKSPIFQEKFVFTLIEGLREMNVAVWNSNTLSSDDFIGGGKILLHKVISQGYDDSSWPLLTKSGKNAGEVRLIMHYSNAASTSPFSSAPAAPPVYSPFRPHSTAYPSSLAPYPPPPAAAYPPPPYAATSSSYYLTPYPPFQHHSSSSLYPPAPYTGSYPPPHYYG